MSIEEMSNQVKLANVYQEYKTSVNALKDAIGNLDGKIQQIEGNNTYNITASKEEIESINYYKDTVNKMKELIKEV